MLYYVQNLYFAIENNIRCHFCMFFSNICFDRSYFPISFAAVLIARGKKHHCIIEYHEGKSLLTENTRSQNNHSPWLFGQSWCYADSPRIVQNAVFSVQNTVYGIHTVYIQCCTVHIQYNVFIHELCAQVLSYLLHWNLSYMRLILTTVKNCHKSNLLMIMRSYYTMIIMLKRSIWPHWQSENQWSASGQQKLFYLT